jgi:hypothetical protein
VTSVSDPDSDPEFWLKAYPDPEQDPRLWWAKNEEKNTAEKKFKNFWIKNYNLLIPRPPQRTSKLQETPSALKREHSSLQNMKFLKLVLFLWLIFELLDPDPDSKSGSTDLIESGRRSGSKAFATI